MELEKPFYRLAWDRTVDEVAYGMVSHVHGARWTGLLTSCRGRVGS